MDFGSLKDLLESFRALKVLVVGDVMLDRFSYGKPGRTSPETEVPIIELYQRENFPGGAANVALTIRALGATPFLVAPIGSDPAGDELIALLENQSMSTVPLFRSGRKTTVKERVFVESAPTYRFDEEDTYPLSASEFEIFKRKIESVISGIDIILIQDYDKGCICDESITYIMEIARRKGLKIVADPKHRNFLSYQEIALLKPNKREFEMGTGMLLESPIPFTEIQRFRRKQQIEKLIITLGSEGLIAADESGILHFETLKVENPNLVGAGDLVVGLAALCIAKETPLMAMAPLLNLYAGIKCKKTDYLPVHSEELLAQVKTVT